MVENDGSVPADLRGITCGEIVSSITGWIDGHKGCVVDADCTILYTDCGLPGGCGTYVNNGAPGPYFDSLLDGWRKSCNPNPCLYDCIEQPPAACNNGICAAGRAFVRQPVGEPCTDDRECETGQCVTEQASGGYFRGGFCTIKGCDSINTPCPSGSSCRPGGDGVFYCLKDCCALCDVVQCRDGWACCEAPGPMGEPGSCLPAKSMICGQK